jgi:hypothetical protein
VLLLKKSLTSSNEIVLLRALGSVQQQNTSRYKTKQKLKR